MFFFAFYIMKARNVVVVYQVVFCLSENGIDIGIFHSNILIAQWTKRYPNPENFKRILT
jgi:hypothetical protein